MGKLYELLSVEGALKDVYTKILNETAKIFNKDSLFTGQIKRLEMFSDEDKGADGITERQERETTVSDKLHYMKKSIIDYYDIQFQKDCTNQEANDDIVLEDGTVIAESVPATFLLSMENKMKHIRTVLDTIPTLEKGVKWVKDTQEGKGVYKTEHSKESFKTQKFRNSSIVAPATKEHKAQVELWNDMKNVGKYYEDFTSGKITSAQKSDLLQRFDEMLNAIHQARVRANDVQINQNTVTNKIMDYILGDL